MNVKVKVLFQLHDHIRYVGVNWSFFLVRNLYLIGLCLGEDQITNIM